MRLVGWVQPRTLRVCSQLSAPRWQQALSRQACLHARPHASTFPLARQHTTPHSQTLAHTCASTHTLTCTPTPTCTSDLHLHTPTHPLAEGRGDEVGVVAVLAHLHEDVVQGARRPQAPAILLRQHLHLLLWGKGRGRVREGFFCGSCGVRSFVFAPVGLGGARRRSAGGGGFSHKHACTQVCLM